MFNFFCVFVIGGYVVFDYVYQWMMGFVVDSLEVE